MNWPIPSSNLRARGMALGLFAMVALLHSSCGGKSSTAPPNGPSCDLVRILAFGSVPVGASATRGFIIRNGGGGTLAGSVSVSCPGFTLLSPAGYSLAAGERDTFFVRFSPSTVGPDTCQIQTSCGAVIALGTGTP